jgi:hypothetical protein
MSAASKETEAFFMVSKLQRFSEADFMGNALLDEREGYFFEKPGAETSMHVERAPASTPALQVVA